MSKRRHPWMLTAPWYRWSSPGKASAGRRTKPEIQQYAGFDYAREFLSEPQRSLVPQARDYFHRTLLDTSKAPSGFELGDPGPNDEALPFGLFLREATQIRKLYQPIHGYSYLVVSELHCDVPGLPSVDVREVEEAGFVVRRVKGAVDADYEPLVKAELDKIALIREQLRQFDSSPKKQIHGKNKALKSMIGGPVDKKQAELIAALTEHQLALDQFAAAMSLQTEGWIVDANDPTRGRWVELDELTPERELEGEAWVAMNSLFPDPGNEGHSARGRTMFSGTIPTGGREVEGATLAPRFDDRHLYEIRCFVRRKHEKPGCPGDLVWGPPSVAYRIAADADPEAGARLPISITVPSFSDVKAFADRMATGAAGGVRIVTPPDSVMPFSGDFGETPLEAGNRDGIGQICFIAILLLFLIALFLMFAFLPIIVFLFQLFFLLRLKFCIPPALDISLEVAVKLKAEFEVDFELSADFKAEMLVDLGFDTSGDSEAQIDAKFDTWVNDELGKVYKDRILEELLKADLSVRVQRLLDLRTDFRGTMDPELVDRLNFGDWPKADPEPVAPPSDEQGSMTPPLPFVSELVYYPRLELPS